MTVTRLADAQREDLEQAARVDLAAAFRWAARLNWHEAIANHFSFAVSEDGARFLVNPYGRHFSRMRASDLILLDANDPASIEGRDDVEPTAWAIHGAVHRSVPRARCILHVHSKYATVLATLADSRLPPIDQNTMRFHGRVAVDEGFQGMGLGDEAERLATVMDGKPILMMGNHGVMVTADSVAKAFDDLYYFERACETAVTAYMTGRPLRLCETRIAETVAAQSADEFERFSAMHLSELKAILDDEGADYRD